MYPFTYSTSFLAVVHKHFIGKLLQPTLQLGKRLTKAAQITMVMLNQMFHTQS